ncbi:MAG: RNA polymerase sigma factor [Desulfobacteraceae bacterium]|nr:RNA polymerase sigma factor [Desulfobacteraceae bacterium]
MELAIFEQDKLDHNYGIVGEPNPYATGYALFPMSLTENQNLRDSTPPGGSDQILALVERARAGDRDAFEKIILAHQNEIYRLAYLRTRSRMDAEDLTQEVFLAAFRYLPQLKDSDRFRPWLYRIAINRVRDFHRRKKFLSFFGMNREEREEADPADFEPHRVPGALDKVIRDEFWSQVRELSKRFSPVEKEVFFLRFVDNFNLREIAQVLKKSESAVKTHLYRAIKKFKEDSAMSGFLEGEWHGDNRPS